jgi:hypothetical protein
MGWSNPQQFMVPPTAMGAPPPELLEKQAKLKIEQQKADAQSMVAEATAAEKMANAGLAGGAGAPPDPLKAAEIELKNREIDAKMEDAQLDAVNRLRDRESRERVAAVNLAKDIAKNPAGLAVVDQLLSPDMIQRLESNEQPLQES